MIVQDVPAEVRTDPAALYAAAVTDRRAGRHAAAVAKLDIVLTTHPSDVDARLNRGLSRLALNDLAGAEADFRTVLAVAPDYVDARLGLARVAQRRGDADSALREAQSAAAAAPGRPDAIQLARTLRPAPPWRLDLDTSTSRLGAGLPDWREARLGAARRVDGRWTFGGAAEWTRRFDEEDVYAEARLDRRDPRSDGYVAVGGAVRAEYRPEIALKAGADILILPRLSGALDVSAARFASGRVTSVQPGLATDLAQGRLRLSARWIVTWDETDSRRSGYALGAVWSVSDRLRLRLDHADAPESSEGVTVDVRSLGAGAEFDLTDRTFLRVGVLHEDRGAYDRQAVTAGLGWRFW
jgi:YaiO family outer membrane protein